MQNDRPDYWSDKIREGSQAAPASRAGTETSFALPRFDVDDLNSSTFGKRLQTQWRSLLEESTEALDAPSSGSLFFRPRTGFLEAAQGNQAQVDDELGDFQLIRLVGIGSMGQVWEAHQRGVERSVALKLIRPDRLSPTTRDALAREAKAAGRLHHPSIVEVYATGETRGVHWIAQEFVDGECTLGDFLHDIENEKTLPRDYDRRIALFFYQLAEALAAAHDANVTHRDLKPENILIAEDERPKLSDFGLARLDEDEALASGIRLEGTPRYMAPEQVLGQTEKIGRQSDVFSLGALLYKALTLKSPFPSESLSDLLQSIVEEDPAPCRQHRSTISPDLEAIVSMALRKSQDERYANMHAVAADLASYLDHRPVSARPVAQLARMRMFVERNRALAAVGLAATLLLALALTFAREARAASRSTDYVQLSTHIQGLVTRGLHSQARAGILELELLDPLNPQTSLLEAQNHMSACEYNLANAAFQESEERGYDPNSVDATSPRELLLRAAYKIAAQDLDQYRSAHADLLRSIELDPNSAEALYALSLVEYALGDVPAARSALTKYQAQLRSGDPQVAIVDARIAQLDNDPQRAIVALQSLLDNPDVPRERLEELGYYGLMGKMLVCSTRFDEGIEFLDQQLALRPLDDKALRLKGFAMLFMHRTDPRPELLAQARELVTKSLETARFPRLGLLTLAQIEDSWNEVRPHGKPFASIALERFATTFPGDPDLALLEANSWLQQGYELWNAGRKEEGARYLKATLERIPNSFGALIMLSQHVSFNRPEQGLQLGWDYIERAVALVAYDVPDPVYLGGDLYFPSGERALPYWHLALYSTRTWLAASLGLPDAYEDSIIQMERLIAAGTQLNEAELLTYAEGLITPNDESWRRPARAEELLTRYLEARAGTDLPAEHAPVVQLIQGRISKNQ